jgi:hypothetical protein
MTPQRRSRGELTGRLNEDAFPLDSTYELGIWIAEAWKLDRFDFAIVRHKRPRSPLAHLVCTVLGIHGVCTAGIRVFRDGPRAIVVSCIAGTSAAWMMNPESVGLLDASEGLSLPDGSSLEVPAAAIVAPQQAFTVIRHFFHYGERPDWLEYRRWPERTPESVCSLSPWSP